MTGAMYAAISGLKTHMSKLNVIGNNISNVNTAGYKAAHATFKESLYTTVTAGSNGTAQVGGVNPSQLGYGCSIGSIALDMSTGQYVPDGNNMHCMIDGPNFFITGDKAGIIAGENGSTLETVDPKNMQLTRVGDFLFDSQGYLTDGNGNVVYGFANTRNAAGADVISGQLVPIRLPLAAVGSATVAAGSAVFPTIDATTGMNVYDTGTGDDATSTGMAIKANTISIDKNTGKITAVNEADDEQIVIGYLALASVSNPAGVTHLSGPYYMAGEGAGDCEAVGIGGVMDGINVNNATGADAETVKNAGGTKLITGGLESSGTDLATEISEMITTQRGYQANTRIITVTDSMLEELVNMKR